MKAARMAREFFIYQLSNDLKDLKTIDYSQLYFNLSSSKVTNFTLWC